MNRDDRLVFLRAGIIAALVLLAAALYAGRALAADLAPVDCAIVRAHIAEHGKAKAVAWARGQGYSWSEIWRIRKQCGI